MGNRNRISRWCGLGEVTWSGDQSALQWRLNGPNYIDGDHIILSTEVNNLLQLTCKLATMYLLYISDIVLFRFDANQASQSLCTMTPSLKGLLKMPQIPCMHLFKKLPYFGLLRYNQWLETLLL
ncbi:hypothetical protein QVD17_15289 [Tagetes erecta]|uniref:Uncharacterized protein n=1 Tax=Tagetes erecta TaxID=13708 RepID=A0AAD8KPJ2_TARER|nr:hypothetical protein QVD17_15289 [Tagetes erecta]